MVINGRYICLHLIDTANKDKSIWIRADSIVVVKNMCSYTAIAVDVGEAIKYKVQETAESIMGLIKQVTCLFDNYVYPVPAPVNLIKTRAEEEEK